MLTNEPTDHYIETSLLIPVSFHAFHPHPVQRYKEEFLARPVTFSSSNFGRIKGLVGREDEEGLVEN